MQVRSLKPDDLAQVVAIDGEIQGRPRDGFFRKRLAAAQQSPKSFLTVAVDSPQGQLIGFVFARIQEGDFGDARKVAVLDTLAVDRAHRGQGIAKAMMIALEDKMRSYHVAALRTQADWRDTEMLGFFAAAGFTLAPRLVVERSTENRAELAS